MVADLLVVGLVVRVILGAVKEGRERRDAGPAGTAAEVSRQAKGVVP
jgi:hypothetical protein